MQMQREQKPSTRLQMMRDEGQEPDMPPKCVADYLVGYLMDVGPIAHSGVGAVPVSHGEIAAWQSNTGVELTAWESSMLRRLSSDYVAESHDAQESDCPAPYAPEAISDERRDAVAAQLRAAFGGRARKGKDAD